MKLCEELKKELNEEKLNLSKINEAVSDKDRLALIKGEFKNVLGSHIVDKATDEELLILLKLNHKRETAWQKHNKEMEPINKEVEAIHRKYRSHDNCIGY